MTVWPENLPQIPLRDSYAPVLPDNVERSQTDSRMPRQRRVSTVAPSQLTATFRWTSEEYTDLFLPFYQDDLGDGTLSFTGWTEPLTGAAVTARLVGGSPPRPRPGPGSRVDVTLTMEILP